MSGFRDGDVRWSLWFRLLVVVLSALALAYLLNVPIARAQDGDGPTCTAKEEVRVLVRFSAAEADPMRPLAGHRLFIGEEPGVYSRMVEVPETGAAEQTTEVLLDSRVNHYLMMRSWGPGGESDPSNELTFNAMFCLPPKPPTLLQIWTLVEEARLLLDRAEGMIGELMRDGGGGVGEPK